jgi:hypothetical protein
MDLFVVPTISFRLLYGLLILHHDRVASYGWRDGTPDCRVGRPPAPGSLRMGSGTNIPAARSRSGLWSGFHPGHPRHGYSRSTNFAAVAMAKKPMLIGSIRRKCVDYIVVFGERHLRHALEDMLGETMPLQNGIRAGNFLDQSSFSLLPLQPYFIAEVRCFALFRNYRGSFVSCGRALQWCSHLCVRLDSTMLTGD